MEKAPLFIFTMQSTTALRKITSLRKKIRGIQGGQGAGKTIAIMMLIINHASSNSNKECYVISAELTKMRDTVIKDTIKILQAFDISCKCLGIDYGQPKIIFPNGSFIRFIGMDKDDIGKGLRSDVVFVNEANKISFEAYREATSRAKNIYIDFNPNSSFWFHEQVQIRHDCDFIKLTFQDNEFLPKEEREEILMYYKLGYGIDYDPKAKILLEPISKYWANKWRVYGLGEIGILDGAVFEKWEIIDEIPQDARVIGGGVDFGYVNPAAWEMGYKWNGNWIFDQIVYETHLSNRDLADMCIAEGFENEVHYADSAEPKSIAEIRDYGVNIHPCDDKRDLVNYGVQLLNYDTFYITRRSVETIAEAQGYIWDKDKNGMPTGKPKKHNDHAMNAICYLVGTEGKYSGTYR